MKNPFLVVYRGYKRGRTAARVGAIVGKVMHRCGLYGDYTSRVKCNNNSVAKVLTSVFNSTILPRSGTRGHYRTYNAAFSRVARANGVKYTRYCRTFGRRLLPCVGEMRNTAARVNGARGDGPVTRGHSRVAVSNLHRRLSHLIGSRGCRRTTVVHSGVGRVRNGHW